MAEDFDWDAYLINAVSYNETEDDRAFDADADEPEVMTSADYYFRDEAGVAVASANADEVEFALANADRGFPGRFVVNGEVFTDVAMQDDGTIILRGDGRTAAFGSVSDFMGAAAPGSFFDEDTYFNHLG